MLEIRAQVHLPLCAAEGPFPTVAHWFTHKNFNRLTFHQRRDSYFYLSALVNGGCQFPRVNLQLPINFRGERLSTLRKPNPSAGIH